MNIQTDTDRIQSCVQIVIRYILKLKCRTDLMVRVIISCTDKIVKSSIVITIRDVPQGDFVGYDRAYQTERDSKIAILPIGYGDGFPRNLSCGKASVKIGTYIVPIIGRICMDQLAIDITDTEGVAVGDTATLIDNQENSLLSTPCVAERSDSISNEILSRMGARLPIVIKE